MTTFDAPRAYLYARCSDPKQAERGDSVNDQVSRATPFFEQLREYCPDLDSKLRAIKDEGVSASKKAFFKRPGGRELLKRLQPGDHLIVDKIDRIWRSLKDFVSVYEWLQAKDISLDIINLGGMQCIGSTPMGNAMLQMSVVFAELESNLKSERVTQSNIERAKQGRLSFCRPMLGMRISKRSVANGPYQLFVEWDADMRATMADIVRMSDAGLSVERIAQVLNQKHQDKNNRPAHDKIWKTQRVSTFCVRERYYQKLADRGLTSAADVQLQWREDQKSTKQARKRNKKRKRRTPANFNFETGKPEGRPFDTIDPEKIPAWAKEAFEKRKSREIQKREAK